MKIFPESASPKEASVKDLIEKHRVCYEWCNEYDMVNEVRTSIGYSLRLYGCNIKHEVDGGCETEPVPGCPVCRKTYDDLVCVARWIVPTQKRESQYKIEPFDSAFHSHRGGAGVRRSSFRFRFCTVSTSAAQKTNARAVAYMKCVPI